VVISDGDGGDHELLTAEGPSILHPITAELAACWAGRHGEDPSWATAMIEVAPQRLFSYSARHVGPAELHDGVPVEVGIIGESLVG
jgi:hypothetical protein